jgi:hypothetical protein
LGDPAFALYVKGLRRFSAVVLDFVSLNRYFSPTFQGLRGVIIVGVRIA